MDVNLEEDIKKDPEIISLCADRDIAVEFYRAMCNMRWKKNLAIFEDEQIVAKLKGKEINVWSCSWRCAGGIIADIRSIHHGFSENYMDFYCSGEEGWVSPLVEKHFERLGWIQYPWQDADL